MVVVRTSAIGVTAEIMHSMGLFFVVLSEPLFSSVIVVGIHVDDLDCHSEAGEK